jgi:hypothetical protein
MLEGSYGQMIDLGVSGDQEQEPLPPVHSLLKRLQELDYSGPAPRTVGEAAQLVRREEFRRMPPTTQQRRLIEVICLYGGEGLAESARTLSSRWDAGCWIKTHCQLAGDWLFFDG